MRDPHFPRPKRLRLAMFQRPMIQGLLPFAVAALLVAPPVVAQKDPGAPKPDTYICPSVTSAKAIDCFLNAVEHLYTMCRQVKSIEIIEFGYDKSEEGVNGAKSEYCVDKHKLSMTRPYQAALREATGTSSAVDGLRQMHDLWLKALAELKWVPGESDDHYKLRVARPYDVFSEQAGVVRVALEQGAARPGATAASAGKPVTKAKPSATTAAKPPATTAAKAKSATAAPTSTTTKSATAASATTTSATTASATTAAPKSTN